jgi:hypothetical protein
MSICQKLYSSWEVILGNQVGGKEVRTPLASRLAGYLRGVPVGTPIVNVVMSGLESARRWPSSNKHANKFAGARGSNRVRFLKAVL